VISVFEGQTYVVSGYFAMLAALLVLAGALSDRYGRRRIYALGLAGFGITSIMCGLAPSLEALAATRLLQGAAGALLVPGSLSVITSIFDEAARPRAIGIWAAATSAATLFGPLLGGVLVDAAGWRAIFLINIPILVVALWLTLRYVPESRDAHAPARFDWLGAAVAGVAVGGLALGIVRGQERGWSDPVAIVALGAGIGAAIAFPIMMVRRPDPLVPPALFRRRVFTVVNISTFLLYGALYVSIQFTFLFLIGVVGYSPLGAALVSMPVNLLLVLLSTRIGTLAGRTGPRRFLVAGPIIVAVAFAWLAGTSSDAQPWRPVMEDPGSLLPPGDVVTGVLAAMTVFGIGMGLVVAPLTSTLMASIPVAQAGVGSAINNAVSRVGQPLLAAIAFIVVNTVFYAVLGSAFPSLDFDDPALRAAVPPLNPSAESVPAALSEASRIASADAFQLVMLMCAVLAVLAAFVNGVGLRRREPA
jgi:EmrB/QacA subfamily drug resistance transporter